MLDHQFRSMAKIMLKLWRMWILCQNVVHSYIVGKVSQLARTAKARVQAKNRGHLLLSLYQWPCPRHLKCRMTTREHQIDRRGPSCELRRLRSCAACSLITFFPKKFSGQGALVALIFAGNIWAGSTECTQRHAIKTRTQIGSSGKARSSGFAFFF